MSGLGPHQIVAPVVRWPDHDVMAAENPEGAFEDEGRKVRAVAIEGDDLLAAGSGEMSKSMGETCGEAFSLLLYNLHCITEQLCQLLLILLRAHHGDLHAHQRFCQRERVLQEAAIQFRHRRSRQAFRQTRLDPPWLWGFRHNDQGSA